MKRFIFAISVFVFIGSLTSQPSEAGFVASYEQSIIIIHQIDTKDNIFSEDGQKFLSLSSEVLTQAKSLLNSKVRVLYIVMGSKKIISEIQPNIALEFNRPETPAQHDIVLLKQ